MIKGLAHFGIAANNSEALAQWYCEYFGMEIVRNVNNRVYFVDDKNGAFLEFYPAKSDREEILDNGVKGVRHLAIRCTDFDAEYKRLVDAGIKPAAEIVSKETYKLGLFYDLEDNLFHLVERFDDVSF